MYGKRHFLLHSHSQAKEKLIATLRQGSDSSSDNVSPTLLSELEEAKQERDLLRDELQQNKYKMEQLRTEYLVREEDAS